MARNDFISIEWRNLKKYERHLETFAKRAVPFAMRDVVNSAAFATQKHWRGEIKRTFTLRNQWTVRSIQVDMARGLSVRSMEARTGSLADYMQTQEQGGTVKSKSGGAKAIPTEAASGQAMGTSPRKKPVRRPNRFSSLGKIPRVSSTGGRKARNARAIERATRGSKIAYLDLGKRKGIYRITGKRKLKIRKLYDLSRSSVTVKREPTLQGALKRTGAQMPSIMAKALLKQLKHHRILGY